MQTGREIVHTVTDYYDGARGGIADFHGIPHVYHSLWNDLEGDWDDFFLLQPVDEETFLLAMEDWEIWLRWEAAFRRGQTDAQTHPALPADRARHDAIETILEPRLKIDVERAIRVRGRFSVQQQGEPGLSSTAVWVVSWLDS